MGKFPQRKGFWIRAAAAAIDLVLVLSAFVLISMAIYAFQSKFAPSTLVGDERIYGLAWCLLVIGWLSFEIFLAATPAKLILGLCIANANGTPAPRSMRFHRWITKTWCFWLGAVAALTMNEGVDLLGRISFGLLLVGCTGAANDYRQTWHDEIAHTAVFRRRDIYGPRATARGFDTIPPALPPS